MNLFETLLNFGEQDTTVQPGLAKEWEATEDGLTYTFKLKDAMWSNGDAVTANDFVYSWRRLADPDTASEYGYIMGIAGLANAAKVLDGTVDPDQLGVVALDDTTLEVTLENPVPFFESLMAFPSFFPMNEAFMNEMGDDYGTSPETLIANGAFKMDSYEPLATTVKLVKKDDCYAAANVVLDGVNFQFIKYSQQAMLSYQNGHLDGVA